MNGEEVLIGVASEKAVQIDRRLPPCPPLGGHAGAGVIDEDSAHGFGGGRKEGTAAVGLLVSDQSKVRFVNQGGGVEGLPRGFGRDACGGEPPQFVVDEREKVGGGLAVAAVRGFEQAGHIGHHGRVYQLKAAEPQEHEGDLALPPPRRVRQLNDVSILTARSIRLNTSQPGRCTRRPRSPRRCDLGDRASRARTVYQVGVPGPLLGSDRNRCALTLIASNDD